MVTKTDYIFFWQISSIDPTTWIIRVSCAPPNNAVLKYVPEDALQTMLGQ